MSNRLRRLLVIVAFFCIGLTVVSAPVHSQEIIWSGLPLDLAVKPDTDRLIIFPSEVDVDIPKSIIRKVDVSITRPGYVLVSATESFNPELIRVRSINTGSVMLIRLASRPDGDTETVRIIDALELTTGDPEPSLASPSVIESMSAPADITLIRFAAQTLYAPSRLLPGSDHIYRAGKPSIPDEFRLLNSIKGEAFEYHPVAAWAGFGLYVTAIEVRNLSQFKVELDPRQVRQGAFQGASFQHQYVTAKDTREDRTTLYLVSVQPFGDAIRGYRRVSY